MATDQAAIEELSGIQALTTDELASVEVDDLVAELDGEAPTYRSLYYRWERQQWVAGELDFEPDARDWTHRLFPEQRSALLWLASTSTAGEPQLAQTLVAFVDAAPTEEQGVFLTTQLADVGRHAVFFDRFGEAIGKDLAQAGPPSASPGKSGDALAALLTDVSEALQFDREAEAVLVRGVCAHHLLAQGVVAMTARRFLLRYLQEQEIAPTLRLGAMAQMRDEVRHIQFGVRFVKEHATAHARDVDETFDRAAPMALGVLQSPDVDLQPIGIEVEDLRAYAYRQLTARAGSVGIDWTPPEETSSRP